MRIVLESRKYHNEENNWMLTEERIFCNDKMMEVYLQVYDLKTMKTVSNEIIDDDVWAIDWKKIDEEIVNVK